MRGRSQLHELLRLWDSRPGPIPLDELLASLKSLEIGPDDLGAARVFDERAYHRAAIYRAEHFEALVLCWRGGQCSPIHDHTGSSCAVRVVA
ncbi:cupin domain-containing protein, partial [Singulisphaera rosea]